MYRLALLLALLPALAFAEVIDTAGAQPGTYLLTIAADGSATVSGPTKLVRLKDLGGPTNPPPDNPPPGNTVHARALALTSAALVEGGSHATAAKLAVVYGVVADQVEKGTLTPPNVAPALKALTDAVVPAGEAAIWGKWRIGIGDLLTGRTETKEAAVATLRSVSDGTRAAVNGSAAATGAEAIAWDRLLDLLLPILLKLLEKWLLPMAM